MYINRPFFFTTNMVSIHLSICGVDSPDRPIDIPLAVLTQYSLSQISFIEKPLKCSPKSESIISKEIPQFATSLQGVERI